MKIDTQKLKNLALSSEFETIKELLFEFADECKRGIITDGKDYRDIGAEYTARKEIVVEIYKLVKSIEMLKDKKDKLKVNFK